MSTLVHIADRVLNRPLLITPEKAQVIMAVLSGRIGIDAPEASRFEGTSVERDNDGNYRLKPYKVADGVAIISIVGSLVNRGAWIGANSGLVSYEGIQHQLKAAASDDKVSSIILDLSSPGGEAVGAFETAAVVRDAAKAKRVVALVNGMAASAAYAIASGASEIVTTETGVSGSIGVVLLHADYSRHLADKGVKPTLIFAGAHKVDGNPFEPLPDDVRGDLQAEVDAFYRKFLSTVSEGRGARLTAEMARATEARTFLGQTDDGSRDAVANGLADRVGTFESVLAELQQHSRAPAGRPIVQQRRTSMDKPNGNPAAETEAGATFTQAQLDAAVKAARDEGFAAGAKAENARILSIEANALAGHDKLIAEHKADLAMTPEKSAMAILAAEKAKPQDPRHALAALDRAAAGIESRPSADGDGGQPQPKKATTPEGWKAEWDGSAELQAEYPNADSYVAMKKREARLSGLAA